jgi:hypothetical protein
MAVLIRANLILECRMNGGMSRTRYSLAGPALAWIRQGMNRLESMNRNGLTARTKASKNGDDTMASGRDYFMTFKHMEFIRELRSKLLRRYSTIKVTKQDVKRIPELFAGIEKPARPIVLLGRRAAAGPFSHLDNGSTPRVMEGAVQLRTLGHGEAARPRVKGKRVTHSFWRPYRERLNYRDELDGTCTDIECVNLTTVVPDEPKVLCAPRHRAILTGSGEVVDIVLRPPTHLDSDVGRRALLAASHDQRRSPAPPSVARSYQGRTHFSRIKYPHPSHIVRK